MDSPQPELFHMTNYTVRQLTYTPVLRLINALVWILGLVTPITNLGYRSLHRAAVRRTGLSDFGPSDYTLPLIKLMEMAEARPLTAFGRLVVRQAVVTALVNRLRIAQYVKLHPDVTNIEVKRPIFVLGFPRTGTTVLQNLLACAPGYRALEFWELIEPVPTCEDREKDVAGRKRRASLVVRLAYWLAPEQGAMHHLMVDSTEECWTLFFNSFQVLNYDLSGGFTEFGNWIMERGMREAYAYYKLQLQILAHQRGEKIAHLVLKCPEHLWFLHNLFEIFPDARVVQTHRDPVECVASYASMSALQRRMMYGKINHAEIGAHIQERFRIGIERAMEARRRLGCEDQFFDVTFTAFAPRDLPRETLARNQELYAISILRSFGVRIPNETVQNMRAWFDNRRTDGMGSHHYSPEQWHLDVATLLQEFAPYIEEHEVPGGRWS